MAARYTTVAIALHWLIAGLIVANLFLGWRMDHVTGMSKFTLFQLHKSVGISVLGLSLLRLVWRLLHRPPPYPVVMQPWERHAARWLHAAFYMLMIGLPLSGWIIVSASPMNIPTLLFNTLPLPHLGPIHDLPMATRRAIDSNLGSAHVIVAYVFGALIVLHVAAALKHKFVQRDGVLGRMLPGT